MRRGGRGADKKDEERGGMVLRACARLLQNGIASFQIPLFSMGAKPKTSSPHVSAHCDLIR